jgi:hypothetical protein
MWRPRFCRTVDALLSRMVAFLVPYPASVGLISRTSGLEMEWSTYLRGLPRTMSAFLGVVSSCTSYIETYAALASFGNGMPPSYFYWSRNKAALSNHDMTDINSTGTGTGTVLLSGMPNIGYFGAYVVHQVPRRII